MHVHLVGNGQAGSGCWLRPGLMHRMLADWMLKQIGLPVSWRAPEFDEAYVELLVRWLRESAITHAVLLAHEEVYDEHGHKLKFGSFHIPNNYLFTVCRAHPELLPAVSIHPRGSQFSKSQCRLGGESTAARPRHLPAPSDLVVSWAHPLHALGL